MAVKYWCGVRCGSGGVAVKVAVSGGGKGGSGGGKGGSGGGNGHGGKGGKRRYGKQNSQRRTR